MNSTKQILLIVATTVLTLTACTNHPSVPSTFTTENSLPSIYPDYTNVVVPPNIAPLNFGIRGNVADCVARFTFAGEQTTFGSDNKVLIDEDEWHTMLSSAKGGDIKVEVFTCDSLGTWHSWQEFNISVAEEDIDPYVSYRLIYPSYVAYEMLSINQRNLTNFDESDIFNNFIVSGEADGQCINCHSYQNFHTHNMQFHMRQGHGGTMIVYNNNPTKINLKTDSTISAGALPISIPRGTPPSRSSHTPPTTPDSRSIPRVGQRSRCKTARATSSSTMWSTTKCATSVHSTTSSSASPAGHPMAAHSTIARLISSTTTTRCHTKPR